MQWAAVLLPQLEPKKKEKSCGPFEILNDKPTWYTQKNIIMLTVPAAYACIVYMATLFIYTEGTSVFSMHWVSRPHKIYLEHLSLSPSEKLNNDAELFISKIEINLFLSKSEKHRNEK